MVYCLKTQAEVNKTVQRKIVSVKQVIFTATSSSFRK